MKKALSLSLAFIMLVSVLLTGCGGVNIEKKNQDNVTDQKEPVTNQAGTSETQEFPLKEKVTYTVVQNRAASYKPYQTLTAWNEQFEKKSNIHIEWLDWGTGDAFTQKKKLAFSADDLPDAFYGGGITSIEYTNYGAQGLIIAINDMIEDNMPNFRKYTKEMPEILKQMTAPDGKIYGLPSFNLTGVVKTNDALLYNKIWLEKLGKEIPETTDEFYEYLKAVKAAGDLNENGKDDEIPFSFKFGDKIQGMHSFIGFSGVVLTTTNFIVKDGKVAFAPSQPEFKNAIKYMNKLASEGLIDLEAFTMDVNAYNAKVKSKVPMVGACIGWSPDEYNAPIGSEIFVLGPPLRDPNGPEPVWQRRNMPLNRNINFVITNKAKNPELLLKWADLHYEFDTSVQTFYGFYDKYIKKLGNGMFEEIMKPDGSAFTWDDKTVDVPGNYGLYIIPEGAVTFNKLSDKTRIKMETDALYEPYLEKEFFNEAAFYTPEESERISIISADVVPYFRKMIAKWIYNGGIEEEWDAYLAELNKMGLQEWIEINQKVHDRSN